MEETDDTLIERIRQIVGEVLKVAPDTLKLTDPVFGEGYDLVNSLYWVEVNMAVENEFHLEIPEEDATRLETIEEYVYYIRRRQEGLPPFENRSSPAQPSAKKGTDRKKSIAEPQEQQQREASSYVWEFHQGHWERTEDPMQKGGLEIHQHTENRLQQGGYKPSPILRMGKREQGMRVEVYVKEHKEKNGAQNYYIQLWIGPEVESIYISNLPSLISLLQRLGPIIANSQGVE